MKFRSLASAYFGLLIALSIPSTAFAQDSWIVDPVTQCRFFNSRPQPNETVKFEGQCNGTTATGKLTWFKDGELTEVVEGKWINGRKQGFGTWKSADGEYYQGDYIDDKRTGKGLSKRQVRLPNDSIYEGEFFDDKRTGKGLIKWANGNSYEGSFVDGNLSGKGLFKWANGDVYNGDFINGKRTGKGILKAGELTYRGDFVDGKFNGRGISDYKEWNYEGDFSNNIMSGKGVDKMSGVIVYEGDFLNGKRSGLGVRTYSDGAKYIGSFVGGKETGRGKYTAADVLTYEGDFVDGEFSGNGVLTYPSGKKLAGQFSDGQYVPRGDGSIADRTCQNFGYPTNSADYRECIAQINVAERRAQQEALQMQLEMAKQEQREQAVWRGLAALTLGAQLLAPPPTSSPPQFSHTYTLPGRRTMTCSTLGTMTNCY